MAKLSAKKIRERQLKSQISQFTPKTFTAKMLYTLNEDNFLSFLVGQSICLVLKCLNETKYYDDMPFENYVKETCNLVNSAIPNLGDEEDDIPSSLIAFYTLAILVYGDLIKGITFPIIPMVKAKGYILDVKTSQEGIEITENGRSFLSKANAGNCLFTGKISNQDDLFDGIYKNLAIDYMQKVLKNSKINKLLLLYIWNLENQ